MAKNIKIIRGNTQTISLTVLDANSVPAITSSDTIFFTAKPQYDNDETDANAAISKTLDASSVLNTETGVVSFKLTASEANVEPGKYVYDIVLRQSDMDRVTLLEGKLTVTPAATLRGFDDYE